MKTLALALLGTTLVLPASSGQDTDAKLRSLEKQVAELQAEVDRLKNGPRAGGGIVIAGGNLGVGEVVGSGKLIGKSFALSDFTSVDVSTAFQVEVSYGKAFGVSVTTDDNVIDRVRVEKTGSTLRIALDTAGKAYRVSALRASVTMPAVRGVSLSGAARGTVAGFRSVDDLVIKVAGASSLSGMVNAGELRVEASGASRVDLKGVAGSATLTAEGASQLRLADYRLGSADVRLTGASRAEVRAADQIGFDLSGASRLEYTGRPTVVRAAVAGASSAVGGK